MIAHATDAKGRFGVQEDVLGPRKELTSDKKSLYISCSRCGKSLLKSEARPGPLPKFAPSDVTVEREELCASCYEDHIRGELLPVEEDER
jgi:hypothetical protein